jgi:hypothetical protein
MLKRNGNHCNVGNGEDGFEPARHTDLSAIQLTDKEKTDNREF